MSFETAMVRLLHGLLLPSSLLLSFFLSDLHNWILRNLCSQLLCANGGPPWSFVFVSTLWQLWKGRNDLVFNNVRHTSNVIVHRALTWACYYSGSFPLRTPSTPSTCSGAIGGLLRDHSGSWISGFQKSVGKCSVIQAELWAIYTGLIYAWDQGLSLLLVQSNSKDVVTMLNSIHAANSVSPLSVLLTGYAKEIGKRKYLGSLGVVTGLRIYLLS
ncbi:hypothetical protein V6N11_033315 [Hibiscus sabdariffa]|uniref:RNase H type-1 domain-containing protein n=1 Tax=Hibiscus sabdariffa TaxID=183260 RepID=A0ABR2PY92_9ROSI